MKDTVSAVVETGLVDDHFLKEFARWGIHVNAKPKKELVDDRASILARIRESLDKEDLLRVDETDLDLLAHYLDPKERREGRLVIRSEGRSTAAAVPYCVTLLGEYALPWTEDESPEEVLTNGETYLRFVENDKTHDVYFNSVREVRFGSRMAFIVCTPSKEEDV